MHSTCLEHGGSARPRPPAPTGAQIGHRSVVAVRDAQKKNALGEVGGPAQFPHISEAPVVFIWLIDTSRIRHAVQWRKEQDPDADYTGLQYIDEAFLGLTIGHSDPEEPAGIKPRIRQDSFLHWDTYDADAATNITDYDATLATYFSDYGRPGVWRRQQAAHVSSEQVESGRRHLLRRVFEKAGFGLKRPGSPQRCVCWVDNGFQVAPAQFWAAGAVGVQRTENLRPAPAVGGQVHLLRHVITPGSEALPLAV